MNAMCLKQCECCGQPLPPTAIALICPPCFQALRTRPDGNIASGWCSRHHRIVPWVTP